MESQRPWEMAQEEFACDHAETDIRRMTVSNGVQHWVRQCILCGHNCGGVKREDVPGLLRINPVAFDEGLRQSWQDQRTARLQQIRQEDQSHWWRQYNAYLESPEWKAKRKAVLERDLMLCQGCRKNRATEAHHLTYIRQGREMLFDLVAVCKECHDAIHPRSEEDAS